MAPQELVDNAVERAVISGHEGKSGAGLERVRLADGRVFVVKRIDAASDLTVAATGGAPGHEYLFWRNGFFDRLPSGVTHALVDAWTDGELTVLVTRDPGEGILTWSRRLTPDEGVWVMERTAELHRAFLGDVPAGVAPLERADLDWWVAQARAALETGAL